MASFSCVVDISYVTLFIYTRAIFYEGIYVDEYGEEDPDLRQGRPLF